MIELSRKPHSAPHLTDNKPLKLGIFLVWYACCISLGTSCYYLEPPWELPVNLPPDIVITGPSDEGTLLFQADQMKLWVVGHDLDGDDLDFFWYVPGQEPTEVRIPSTAGATTLWTSEITVQKSAELDGATIECTLWDGTDDAKVRWFVQVPSAGGEQ